MQMFEFSSILLTKGGEFKKSNAAPLYHELIGKHNENCHAAACLPSSLCLGLRRHVNSAPTNFSELDERPQNRHGRAGEAGIEFLGASLWHASRAQMQQRRVHLLPTRIRKGRCLVQGDDAGRQSRRRRGERWSALCRPLGGYHLSAVLLALAAPVHPAALFSAHPFLEDAPPRKCAPSKKITLGPSRVRPKSF